MLNNKISTCKDCGLEPYWICGRCRIHYCSRHLQYPKKRENGFHFCPDCLFKLQIFELINQ